MNPQDPSSTQLRGRWLVAGRAVWVVLAVLAVGLHIASIPSALAYLQMPCVNEVDAECQNDLRLTPDNIRSLNERGISAKFYAIYITALGVTVSLIYVVIAALIFWRQSTNQMALFGSLTLLMFGASINEIPTSALAALHPSWWLPVRGMEALGELFMLSFLYVFPDGRFTPPWTRWLVGGWIVFRIPTIFFPGSTFDSELRLPLINGLLWLVFMGGIIIAQIYRYRRVSSPVQRQQTKWVVFGIIVACGGFLCIVVVLRLFFFPTLFDFGSLTAWAAVAAVDFFWLFIPLSIVMAILRYRLWDIDLIIHRTLVYGTLTASVVGLYILIVGGLGALFRTGGRGSVLISLIATAVVAVLFAPLRDRLQRGVNRLIYGERDDPYAVLSRLGQRLEATLAPDAVLPTIVATVKEALKLPYVAIALDQEGICAMVAAIGTPVSNPLSLALIYQGETIGQLILGPHAFGEDFTPAERRLLDDLAHQAGVAAAAVRLTADLQRSREHLVTAREEERRRLRRDLHDGLGPALASHTLKIGSARALLARDLTAADRLLAELETDIQTALADIRRLVYNLRPPSLDELGLIGAIREAAARYSQPEFSTASENGAKPLMIVVEAPERLPLLPAAVEVAVYRIVQEALVNVVRHAQARTCQIHLWQDGMLRLEITDDGVGLPAERRAGVGLTSMRERALELGGTCQIETGPSGGVHVLAQLPLPIEKD